MTEINSKAIVGEMFEDMSISEMTRVQGSGDVETDTLLSLLTASAALGSAAATYQFTQLVVQTVKGKC